MIQLLQQPKVSFVPVPRGQSQVAEPNDDAIISKVQECALSAHCDCIVLLTNDKGFADVLKHVIVAGKPSTCVIIKKSDDIRCQFLQGTRHTSFDFAIRGMIHQNQSNPSC
jgi:hypothetical protein